MLPSRRGVGGGGGGGGGGGVNAALNEALHLLLASLCILGVLMMQY